MTDIASLVIRVESLEAKTATKNLNDLTNAGGMVEGMVKKLAAAWVGLKLAEQVKESVLLAARYETLGVVMGVMGNNAGYTATQMAQFQQGLEATGISMVGARQSLNMMAAAQLNLAQSSDLARVAQDAAVISGTNSTEAFEALTRSIQTGMVIIAHRAGIMVSYEKAEKEFAATLGKTKEQLTSQELAQARLNAVLEEGRKRQGAYEASMETAGKQLLSMERYVENFKVKFGQAFGPILKELVSGMSQGLKAAAEWIDKNAVGMANFGEAMRSTAIAGEAFLASLSQMAGGAGTASNALDGLSWVVKGIGFTLAMASDVVREAVIMLLKTMEMITYAAYKLAGTENPFARWAAEINATQQATDKFLTSIEQGAQRVSNVAIRTEQLAAAQEMINEYTREYDRLQKAMANAPNSVTADDKDLLNQLGILRDYAKQRKLEIANGQEEVTGPRTTIGTTGNAGTVANDAVRKERESMIQKLREEAATWGMTTEQIRRYNAERLGLGKNADLLELEGLESARRRDITASNLAAEAADSLKEKHAAAFAERQAQLDYEAQAIQAATDFQAPYMREIEQLGTIYEGLTLKLNAGIISQQEFARQEAELVRLTKQSMPVMTQMFGDLRDTIQDWSRDGSEALADFFMTGEGGFKEMVNAWIRDLMRLYAQKQIMDPLIYGSGSGGWGGLLGLFGGSESATGSAAAPTSYTDYNVNPSFSAASFQASAASAAPISIGAVHINAATGTATTDGVSGGALAEKVSSAMREAALAVIVDEKRPGGHLESVGAM